MVNLIGICTQSNDGDVTFNYGGSHDCWVVKLNSIGTIQWEKSLGGSSAEEARSIQQTSDGGYVFVGISRSVDGDVSGHHGGSTNNDYWVVKLDSIGNILWQNSYGGTGEDVAYSILQTIDGGYVVAGNSQSNDGDVSGHHGSLFPSDYWILKLDSVGAIEWQKSIGGTSVDGAFSIYQTIDSGYIVAGSSNSNDDDVTGNNGNTDFWIVKLNTTGTIQWQKSLGGTLDDVSYSIQQTNDGGFIAAGWTGSNDGDVSGNHGGLYDCWVVKIDTIGAIEWQKCLGGTDIDEAACIQQTQDDGFVLTGFSQSDDGDFNINIGGYDSFVIKLDINGNLQWQKILGGTNFDAFESIQETFDGGYILAGGSNSNDVDVAWHYGTTATTDYWVVKLDPLLTNISNSEHISNISIYPNPSTSEIDISIQGEDLNNYEISIINILGEVQKVKINQSAISVSEFSSGVYFISATSKDRKQRFVNKFVKE